MPTLTFTMLKYDPALLKDWKCGLYRWCKKSAASDFIKEILIRKARNRREARIKAGKKGDRRFFGEAFVAAHPKCRQRRGWYGSFKWLTRDSWRVEIDPRDSPFAVEFRAALHRYVRARGVIDLQRRARICKSLFGVKAVVPDLWFFTGKKHRFVEVKLPGDRND